MIHIFVINLAVDVFYRAYQVRSLNEDVEERSDSSEIDKFNAKTDELFKRLTPMLRAFNKSRSTCS